MDEVLRSMTFEFFGCGKHKIAPQTLFTTEGAVLLDVRSVTERESVDLRLQHHAAVLQIPIDEIPDRISEIPRDRLVGIFCSAGVRASLVYAYLRAKGYTDVRIVLGGYEAITEVLKPGPLWKHVQRKPAC